MLVTIFPVSKSKYHPQMLILEFQGREERKKERKIVKLKKIK
jgi:hypothetical protein